MKKCNDCGEQKPSEEFYQYPNGWTHSYCKKCHSIRTKEWRLANPEKSKSNRAYDSSVRKEYREQWRKDRRKAVISLFGGKCVHCGFSDERALQIDHINGGGHTERTQMGSALKLYSKLLNEGTDGYQLLCANCNWIKRAENGEHRKKKA
jgi:hypothetical protein